MLKTFLNKKETKACFTFTAAQQNPRPKSPETSNQLFLGPRPNCLQNITEICSRGLREILLSDKQTDPPAAPADVGRISGDSPPAAVSFGELKPFSGVTHIQQPSVSRYLPKCLLNCCLFHLKASTTTFHLPCSCLCTLTGDVIINRLL